MDAVPRRRTESGSLGAIVRSFKARVTRDVRAARATTDAVWQRNYHEHVIRSEAALKRIREYIATNPARWNSDPDNPRAVIDADETEFAAWLRSESNVHGRRGISTL